MTRRKLVIGNKNYSTWSLRGWLVAKRAGQPFEEELIPLHQPGSSEQKSQHSQAGLVPILYDGDQRIWDTLAIAEYLHEQHPEARLWPEDEEKRAVARAVTCQMHSGFLALRSNMPMNIRHRAPSVGRGPGVLEDIAQMTALWREMRSQYGSGGDFLFGEWCIADAFYTPPAFRFQTYEIPLEGEAAAYAESLLAMPEVREWAEAGIAEPWSIEQYDL